MDTANKMSPEGPARLPCILVVDDEPVILLFFRNLLSQDFSVTEVGSAEAAITALEKQSFDLILSDKNLPGLNGIELARHARKLDPHSKVAIITGYASLGSAREAMELGVVDYLLKPFADLQILRARIGELCRTPLVQRPPRSGSRKVSVFEDDPGSAQRLAGALALLGLDADLQTGRLVKSEPPPLAVLLSWEFAGAPGLAGTQLARDFQVPLIVVSAEVTFERVLDALRAGASGCVAKLTGDVGQLSRELERVLEEAGCLGPARV